MKIRLLIISASLFTPMTTYSAAAQKKYGPQGKQLTAIDEASDYLVSDVLYANSYQIPEKILFKEWSLILDTTFGITGRNQTWSFVKKIEIIAASWSFDKKNTFELGEIVIYPWREKYSEESDHLKYKIGIIVSKPQASQKKDQWIVRVDSSTEIVYGFKPEELGKLKSK